jgi:hypothetical protein
MKRSTIVWTEKVAIDNAWPHDNFGIPIDDNSTDQAQQLTRFKYAQSIGRPLESWTTDDALRACVANKEKPFPGNASPNPAFGLWTTANDYARFLLFAAQNPVRAEPVVRLRGNLAWAAGWGLELGHGGPFAWHWGDSNGIKNIFMLHLPSRTGLILLTNSDNGAHIYRRLVRQYFGREFDAFLMI